MKYSSYDNVFFTLHVLDDFKQKKMNIYGSKKFNHFFYSFPKQSIIIEKKPPTNIFELADAETIKKLRLIKIKSTVEQDHNLKVSDKVYTKLLIDIDEFFRINKKRRNVVIQFKKAQVSKIIENKEIE